MLLGSWSRPLDGAGWSKTLFVADHQQTKELRHLIANSRKMHYARNGGSDVRGAAARAWGTFTGNAGLSSPRHIAKKRKCMSSCEGKRRRRGSDTHAQTCLDGADTPDPTTPQTTPLFKTKPAQRTARWSYKQRTESVGENDAAAQEYRSETTSTWCPIGGTCNRTRSYFVFFCHGLRAPSALDPCRGPPSIRASAGFFLAMDRVCYAYAPHSTKVPLLSDPPGCAS